MNILKINIDAIKRDPENICELLPPDVISYKLIHIDGPNYLIPKTREGVWIYHLILEGSEHGFLETRFGKFTHETGNDYVFDPSMKYTLCKHDIGKDIILQVLTNK